MRLTSRTLLVTASFTFAMACAGAADQSPLGVAWYSGLPGIDTTPGAPAKVKVSGRIVGVSQAPAGSADSLQYQPIARAKIRIMHNVVENGQASEVLAVQLVANDAGEFTVNNLPGGYYIVYADPPAGSIYRGSWSYLSAMQPLVAATVYLWKP
jgi:hypothetical protein